MANLEQKRAAYAWQVVSDHCDDKYTNLSKAAPAHLMNNGLMQTMAFYKSKGKGHHEDLNRDLGKWLSQRIDTLNGANHYADVLHRLVGMDSVTYMRTTEEAYAILRWIRQFADANTGAQ